MNLRSEVLEAKRTNIPSILCQLFSSLIFLVFFGYYAIADVDNGQKCFG